MKVLDRIRTGTAALLTWVIVSCGALRAPANSPIPELRAARATIADLAELQTVDHPSASLVLHDIADRVDDILALLETADPGWTASASGIATNVLALTDGLVRDPDVGRDTRSALISLRAVLRAVTVYAPAE